MQITVSSEIAKRIDERSSTKSRTPPGRRSAGGSSVRVVIGSERKKAGPPVEAPARIGAAAERLVQRLAQASDVIRHGANLTIVQLAGNGRHLRAVLADSVTEGDQLAGGVVGVLARSEEHTSEL